MIIALDWDGTFTRAPLLWKDFAALLQDYGHQLLFVTGRSPDQPITPPRVIQCLGIVYCDGELKSEVVKKLGYQVDIWIDDEPGGIEYCRKLIWENKHEH